MAAGLVHLSCSEPKKTLVSFTSFKEDLLLFEGLLGRDTVCLLLFREMAEDADGCRQLHLSGNYYNVHTLLGTRVADYTPSDTITLEAYKEMTADVSEVMKGVINADSTFTGIWTKDGKSEKFSLRYKQLVPSFGQLTFTKTIPVPGHPDIEGTYNIAWYLPSDSLFRAYWLMSMTEGLYSDFNELAAREASGFARMYLEEINGLVEDMVTASGSSFDYEQASYLQPYIVDDAYIIMAQTDFLYRGGAHGIYYTQYYNYSNSLKKILTLADIIDPKFERNIQEVIRKTISIKYHIPFGEPLTHAEGSVFISDNVTMPDNFSICREGIIFYYGVYELTPYGYGQFEILVPFDALKDYMNPVFRF